jgi:hypothetical protein
VPAHGAEIIFESSPPWENSAVMTADVEIKAPAEVEARGARASSNATGLNPFSGPGALTGAEGMRKETSDSDRLEENASASAIEVASAADRFSHVKTVGEFTTRIRAAWHKSVDGIWDIAKSRLSKEELKELKRDTKFSDPTISMLTSIAKDPRITDPKYRAVLPSSYGTLYALTHLSDAEFESAFNDGVLRPDIERDEVMTLRGKQHAGRAKAEAKAEQTVPPSSHDTLYELTHLSDAEEIEREEVMTLRGKQHSDRAKAKAKRTVLVTILLTADKIDDADLKLLKSTVLSLLDCPSVTVEVSPAWERLLKEAK